MKESIPVPKDTAQMLIDRNGCICSRLFTVAGDSIVEVMA